MSNVNKIVELILSDDETNQELGMMMAVSQGLKDEVLNVLHKLVIASIEKISCYNTTDFDCVEKTDPVTKEIYISYLEAYHHSSYKPNIICHGTVINKAERYLKLKNYNHE
jgi:hypothetical protein